MKIKKALMTSEYCKFRFLFYFFQHKINFFGLEFFAHIFFFSSGC